MKIVSWSVNGIRAAWNHGLASFLAKTDAEIFAFQETKTDEAIPEMELEGYEPYWSFCKRKRGYSGTLVLMRTHPRCVWYSFPGQDFDCEGRIITLDFGTFFLVNCYVPNSIRSEYRKDYRTKWDELLLVHLKKLRYRKPTIVCGDFNVPISDDDIYAENKWVKLNGQGFQSTERENLLAIVESRFVDSYRRIHLEETGGYTWWSSRRYKRKKSGMVSRLFFVSDNLEERVTESAMCGDIMGSDHCPIFLDIDIQADTPVAENSHTIWKKKIHYEELIKLNGLSYISKQKTRT
jgi:exodeoxyribonuclease-3